MNGVVNDMRIPTIRNFWIVRKIFEMADKMTDYFGILNGTIFGTLKFALR